MTNNTYDLGYQAHVLGANDHATLPDHVARDQRSHDGARITVLYHGDEVQAILRGDLYGLDTPGTGDPVVELID